MRLFVSLAGVCALTTPVLADFASDATPFNRLPMSYRLGGGGFSIENGLPPFTDVYNNLDAPSAPLSFISNTNRFLGDQLLLTSPGSIQEVEITLGNSSAGGNTAALTRIDLDLQIYQRTSPTTFDLVTSLNFNDVAITGGLGAGFFTAFTIDLGAGVPVTSNEIILAVKWSDPVGPTTGINALRQVLFNPVRIGSSDNTFLWGDIDGDGDIESAAAGPNNNLGYRVAIPTPATLTLIGLSGLAACRRRR